MVSFVGSPDLDTGRSKFYCRIEQVTSLNPYLIVPEIGLLFTGQDSEAMLSNSFIVGEGIVNIGGQLNRAFLNEERWLWKPVVAGRSSVIIAIANIIVEPSGDPVLQSLDRFKFAIYISKYFAGDDGSVLIFWIGAHQHI